MVHSYKKGYSRELQLVHLLSSKGYMVVRTPRSGRINLASPDIIALKNGRITVIECKAHEEAFKVDGEQLDELKQWQDAGASAYVAWKLARKDWIFLHLHDVVGNSGNIGKKFAFEKGLKLEDIDPERLV
ncbi:MAG: hypothetical protein HYU56_05685 [Candidatus Aenigmarchaeota archaeon]|nr:hypothetical protein [Candidatus Aenigmarchaeota archaeon]